MTHLKWYLPADRYFDPDPAQRRIARDLYDSVADLPLLCPHGHVDPRLFSDEEAVFGTPTELLIIPDHYVFRMLYSQGIPMESLGIPRVDGGPVEQDHRKVWQVFAENFYLFRGTPSGIWLSNEPQFRPRALFQRFNIEVLCTTDAATDTLDHHRTIRESGWQGRIIPTFRPDAVVNIDTPGWRRNIEELSEVSGIEIGGYRAFVQALEDRRSYFKEMGAKATDHAALTAYTGKLSERETEAIFQRALKGQASAEDATRFGRDKGADIPVQVEFTRNLHPLLNRYGNDIRLTLILFNLDETTYSRELATLAGHYPAVKLGPPWWFHDSPNGMMRYFEQVTETAGLHNTVGFNDDTRAFPSIPARHDLWRRVGADWIAGLVVRGIVDMDDAAEMSQDIAYRLAKKAYKL